MANFVHLHVHTGYSFMDGMCKIEELIPRAKELGMTAIAITDHNHLGGTYDFQKQCLAAGIKPILGFEGYYSEDTDSINMDPELRKKHAADKALEQGLISKDEYDVLVLKKKISKITKKSVEEKVAQFMPDLHQYHVIFLAMNQTGWKNIVKLQSEAAECCTYRGRFTCNDTIIAKYNEGLICSTACIASRISRYVNNGNVAAAENLIKCWRDIFGNRLYLEIQPLAVSEQINVNAFYIAMGEKYNLPIIATNDVHYISKEDHDDHDTLLCIGTGKKKSDNDRLMYSNDFWLRSYDEMIEAFKNQLAFDRQNKKVLPDNYIEYCVKALEETNNVAARIDSNIKIGSNKPLIPQVKLPAGETAERVLTKRCYQSLYKLAKRDKEVGEKLCLYEKRLAYELGVICPKGFASYLLVVDEYCNWANNNGCVTGPGRGSAAGSLALYLLGVTKNTDPLKYHMLFERFLTKDRTALPDKIA